MRINTSSVVFLYKKQFFSFCSKIIFAFTLLGLTTSEVTFANFDALTPCNESPAFQKRLTSSTRKLENRLKLYSVDSKEAKVLVNQINATKQRFERYSSSNILCGKEGLPRIIASGQWDHVNEFVLPGILFIYITGWIGWVGRKYVRYASTTENPFENEIIINVPVALSIMNSGFLWPVESWKEFTSGDLLAKEDEVTISPR
jgi:photosystem I subunit 3